MIIAKTTEKGHVIIPAALRKKFNIKKGSRLAVYEGEGNVILIRPLPEDPVEASRGMLKGKTSLLKALLRDRSSRAEEPASHRVCRLFRSSFGNHQESKGGYR